MTISAFLSYISRRSGSRGFRCGFRSLAVTDATSATVKRHAHTGPRDGPRQRSRSRPNLFIHQPLVRSHFRRHARREASYSPRSARTCDTGFMMAASAEMGLRTTLFRCVRSTMTTCVEPLVLSQTVMNLSDSIEHVYTHTHPRTSHAPNPRERTVHHPKSAHKTIASGTSGVCGDGVFIGMPKVHGTQRRRVGVQRACRRDSSV